MNGRNFKAIQLVLVLGLAAHAVESLSGRPLPVSLGSKQVALLSRPPERHHDSPRHSRSDILDVKRTVIAQQAKKFAAKDGAVLWTLANFSWLDFALNWVETVRKAGVQHFFVATLDEELSVHLLDLKIPCVTLPSHLGGKELDWGSAAFKERGLEKIRFIISMLELGMQPMFSDLDVAWLQDPLPYVSQIQEPNILVSSDSCNVQQLTQLDNCTGIMGTNRRVQGHEHFVGTMNVGIHVLRPSALPFVQAWMLEMQESGEMEQLCWNAVFMRHLTIPETNSTEPGRNISRRATLIEASRTHPRRAALTEGSRDSADLLCRSMNGTMKAGMLPSSLFMNGHTFFAQHLKTQMSLNPMAVHASWVAGADMKRFHFREEGLWMVDKPARFIGQRYLTLDLEVPEDLLVRSGPPDDPQENLGLQEAEGHLYLIRHQFLQVKAAAEIAALLNRTLVMPPLWCGIENLWQPNKGRYNDGTQNYTLPMQCSMTQLFEVQRWKSALLETSVLPPFVESNFLSSPYVTSAAETTLTVDACEDSDHCCEPNSQTVCRANQHTIHLPFEVDRSGLHHKLQETDEYRIMKLSNVLKFWRLATRDEYGPFDEAFDTVRRDWCCTKDNKRVFVDIARAPAQTS